MTKTEAIALFGTQAELARALGITRQAVGRWPEELSRQTEDRVVGASLRLHARWGMDRRPPRVRDALARLAELEADMEALERRIVAITCARRHS